VVKTSAIILGLFPFLTLAAFTAYAQEFTLTTTPANTVSSKASIDMPVAEKATFFSSAERFAQMWEKCDTSKNNVP